jgi:methionyl-tRNA synthetase
MDERDDEALAACESALETTAGHIEVVHLREGLRSVMALAQHGNRYIDGKAPWQTIKTDRERTATTLWTALNIVATLRTLCYPYLPHSASKVHRLIGGDGDVLDIGWKSVMPEPGAALPEPEPLFRKLDESVVDEEMKRVSATGVV